MMKILSLASVGEIVLAIWATKVITKNRKVMDEKSKQNHRHLLQ
jgi:hypothetical protein